MLDDQLPSSPTSIHKHIAACFALDAQHFLERYLALHRSQNHALWLVKAFIDLLMAAECGLKAHIVLGSQLAPEDTLWRIKQDLGHKIADLADEANRIRPSPLYDPIKKRLGAFDIQTRYALVADQSFFPADPVEWPKGLDLFRQIAYGPWRECASNEVASLINALPVPTPSNSWEGRVELERRLREVYKASQISPKKRRKTE